MLQSTLECMVRILLAGLLLTGCGSNDFVCSKPTGLWFIETHERSGGTCGELADQVKPLNPEAAGNTICQSRDYDWADDNCSFELVLRGCASQGSKGTPTTVDQTMTMRQTDVKRWEGLVDAMSRTDDGRSCRSAYDVVATKQ